MTVPPEGAGSGRPSDAKKRRLVPESMEDLPEATVAEIIATIDAPPNMVGPEVCEMNSIASTSSKIPFPSLSHHFPLPCLSHPDFFPSEIPNLLFLTS